MRKHVIMPIRVTVSDKKALEKRADKDGLTLCAWVRKRCGLDKYKRVKKRRPRHGKRKKG